MEINSERLWKHLTDLGKIGLNEDTSITRLAFSDEDEQAKDLICQWMEEAGLQASTDACGNLIAVLSGKESSLPPIIIGSHFDTVKQGGRFDGCLGVLSGIEVLQTMRENGIIPPRDIKVIGFRDEEGNRFGYGMIGSHAVCGIVDETGLYSKDEQGITLKEAMTEKGYDPDDYLSCKMDPVYAYLEVHIEQASLLEKNNCPVGIVTGIAGLDRYTITISGKSSHAGATPMSLRKDPVVAMSRWITKVTELACSCPSTVATVGSIITRPGACNIICDSVEFTLDIRSLDDSIRPVIMEQMDRLEEQLTAQNHVHFNRRHDQSLPAALCHPVIQDTMEKCCQNRNYSSIRLASGAGHDCMNFKNLCPVGMIFVRSLNEGASHCLQEYSTREDCAAGCQILFDILTQKEHRQTD